MKISNEDIAYGCALGPKQRKLVQELLSGEWVMVNPSWYPGAIMPARGYGEVGLDSASAGPLMRRLRKNGFKLERVLNAKRTGLLDPLGKIRMSREEVS